MIQHFGLLAGLLVSACATPPPPPGPPPSGTGWGTLHQGYFSTYFSASTTSSGNLTIWETRQAASRRLHEIQEGNEGEATVLVAGDVVTTDKVASSTRLADAKAVTP